MGNLGCERDPDKGKFQKIRPERALLTNSVDNSSHLFVVNVLCA